VFSVPFDIGDKRPTQVKLLIFTKIFKPDDRQRFGSGSGLNPYSILSVEQDLSRKRRFGTIYTQTKKKKNKFMFEDRDVRSWWPEASPGP
jgi:hypothetical protein